MTKYIIKADQVNINMPRPATPKPGFSLLRLHNSKKPHVIANLSSQAKINLINSIAQDIEGCIWAVGHYVKLGVLDSTHTVGFDQVINDIHQDERCETEELLLKVFRRMKRYKMQLRVERKRCKRLEAKLRRERGEERKDRDQSSEENSADSDSSTAYLGMDTMKGCFRAKINGSSKEGSESTVAGNNVAGEVLQGNQSIQTQDVTDEPMTTPPPVSPTEACTGFGGSNAPFQASCQ